MLTGHFAIGFLGKRAEPKLSLGTIMLAALLSDLLFCFFLIGGIEAVRFKPGVTIVPGVRSVEALEATEMAYSHSLLMTFVWGALLSVLYFMRRRNARAMIVLFAAVVSHWVLDFIAHPPDMPLMPGAVQQRFGLGMWKSIPATLLIEGAFWIVAIILYVQIARPRSRTGSIAFWIPVVILTAVWIGNTSGPPPADLSAAGYATLIFVSLIIGWAYWMNRLRPTRP
jgi:hypothetical protein